MEILNNETLNLVNGGILRDPKDPNWVKTGRERIVHLGFFPAYSYEWKNTVTGETGWYLGED